jgi:tetratricopeptide (TPR) repeat protein
VDPLHANNLCNYGLFLSEVRQQYPKAEELYKKVLEFTPNHTNTLYNYAVMLDTHCRRKAEAEDMYRLCIHLEPNHSFVCGQMRSYAANHYYIFDFVDRHFTTWPFCWKRKYLCSGSQGKRRTWKWMLMVPLK